MTTGAARAALKRATAGLKIRSEPYGPGQEELAQKVTAELDREDLFQSLDALAQRFETLCGEQAAGLDEFVGSAIECMLLAGVTLCGECGKVVNRGSRERCRCGSQDPSDPSQK